MFIYSTQLRRARVLAQVSGTIFQGVFERSSDSTFDTWTDRVFTVNKLNQALLLSYPSTGI